MAIFSCEIHGRPEQAGPNWVQVGVLVNDQLMGELDVRVATDQPFRVEVVLPLEAGETMLGVAFLNDYFGPDAPDPDDRDRNVWIDRMVLTGPLEVRRNGNATWRRWIPVQPTAQISRDRALARNLATWLAAAYRRPPTQPEIDRIFQLVRSQRQAGEWFEADLRRALTATLISPHFLFRYEAPAEPGKTRDLTGYELATRLSYFLWGSLPDERLFERAAAGTLGPVSSLRTEARRMLRDRKTVALVENFADQWLRSASAGRSGDGSGACFRRSTLNWRNPCARRRICLWRVLSRKIAVFSICSMRITATWMSGWRNCMPCLLCPGTVFNASRCDRLREEGSCRRPPS